jgi:hypothetical protein
MRARNVTSVVRKLWPDKVTLITSTRYYDVPEDVKRPSVCHEGFKAAWLRVLAEHCQSKEYDVVDADGHVCSKFCQLKTSGKSKSRVNL